MDAVREFVTGDEEMEKEKVEKEREKKRGGERGSSRNGRGML